MAASAAYDGARAVISIELRVAEELARDVEDATLVWLLGNEAVQAIKHALPYTKAVV